jgi:hypothetical protein
VQIRTRLTSDADVEEYEDFQASFAENTSEFLGPFRERIRGVVADASNATGRPMAARGFEAETSIQTVPRRWGVVTYEFRWDGFAASDDQALVVGDVFGGQFYLTENDTLAVAGPDGYRVAAVDPQPAERTDGVVRWFGRRGFPDATPAVRFVPGTPTATAGPGPAPSETAADDGTDDGASPADPATASSPGVTAGPDGSDSGSLPLAAAVLVVGLAAIGAYRFLTSAADEDDPPDAPPADGGTVTATDTGSAGDSGTEEAATAADTDPKPSNAGDATPGVAADDDPLVTDADRVERVLTEADGQLRQTEIVEAFDWSKSKTSRVLSDMAEEGRVEKLRIGRENVIRLASDDDWTDPDESGE